MEVRFSSLLPRGVAKVVDYRTIFGGGLMRIAYPFVSRQMKIFHGIVSGELGVSSSACSKSIKETTY